MRLFVCMVAILALAGCAVANPADMKGKKLTADTSADDILDAMDLAGRDLKDFEADITLIDEDYSGRTGARTERPGKAWFQLLPDGNARIHVLFEKQITDNKLRDVKLEYTLADGWLTERNYKDQKEVRRQVMKPGEKVNLLKLGEGPFPLPIGQKKEDVKAVFNVEKVAADKEDPANSVHLKLTPKPDTSYARRFSEIDAYIDSQTHLPTRISTTDKKGTSGRTTDFKSFKLNPGLKDSAFELPEINDKGWTRTNEEYHD